jgi:hypothetical protein
MTTAADIQALKRGRAKVAKLREQVGALQDEMRKLRLRVRAAKIAKARKAAK